MNLRKFFMGRAVGTIILLCIAGLVAGFYALNNFIYKEKQGDTKISEPYRATLSGVHTCLPYKDTSGPQTRECAIGIKTDAGEYYALDFNLMSQDMPDIQNGMRFTASGVITPIERLSTDHWQKYNVQGIFSVTDSVHVEGQTETPIFTWRFEKADSFNLDGQPETDIFLEVKYPSGKVTSKLIDTTPGGCNELPDSDEYTVANSNDIQCYSAGLGYRFKIEKEEDSYIVLRKTFEEASPGYTPPSYEYEAVTEFPLK